MSSFSKRVVLITGASSGLGRSLALSCASEGASLALIGRNHQRLKEVKTLVKKMGSEANSYVCDVSQFNEVKENVKNIINDFKKIDILVNNAGIWYQGPTLKHPSEKVQELFNINAIGPIYMTQAVLPFMLKRKSGKIFNVISTGGINPGADWGVYTATKHAVKGFTDSLKLELAETGIKVFGFYPGGMDTNLFITSGFNKKHEPWMMDPDHVAKVIKFILSQPEDIGLDHVIIRKDA